MSQKLPDNWPFYESDGVWRKFLRGYVHFTGWSQLSFGVSVDVTLPNFEVHLPFCFIRMGWEWDTKKTLVRGDPAVVPEWSFFGSDRMR